MEYINLLGVLLIGYRPKIRVLFILEKINKTISLRFRNSFGYVN